MILSNLNGKFGWIAYHKYLFTEDRFNSLLPALSIHPRHIAVINVKQKLPDLIVIDKKIYKKWAFSSTYEPCEDVDLKHIDTELPNIPLKDVYFMDAASIIISYLFNIDANSTVLDLCSAPGGKVITIIRRILENIVMYCNSEGHNCRVICNEFNKNRLNRLKKVLLNHIGIDNMKKVNAIITSVDATKPSMLYSLGAKKFLNILVDAPCSSDRHLLLSNNLQEWSMKSAKSNSMRQIRILTNAMSLLEKKGMIIYCTCTLNEIENDKTVEEICSKFGMYTKKCFSTMINVVKRFNEIQSNVKIILKSLKGGFNKAVIDRKKLDSTFQDSNGSDVRFSIIFEYTRYGSYILPDSNNGIGPLYVAFIEKK
ncbi:NOL1/NOP2/sun family protein [Cryptosporidium felis]|nr:NOL1/NOP2/sun family protein [Cryptosporidium felis]